MFLKTFIFIFTAKRISEDLKNTKVPREFSRRSRSLKFANLKAEEHRNLILFMFGLISNELRNTTPFKYNAIRKTLMPGRRGESFKREDRLLHLFVLPVPCLGASKKGIYCFWDQTWKDKAGYLQPTRGIIYVYSICSHINIQYVVHVNRDICYIYSVHLKYHYYNYVYVYVYSTKLYIEICSFLPLI